MITMEKPDVNASGRYSIKDTCRLLGIARSTLQAWERRGYIRRSYYRTGLRPFFTGLEILRCWNAIA
jgi:hypothetical protein